MESKIYVVQYKWAGKLGPFKINSNCQECDITTLRLRQIISDNFANGNVDFTIKPWLDNFFYCLKRGCYHPPIILIDGKKFFQFSKKKPFFDEAELIKKVKEKLKESSNV